MAAWILFPILYASGFVAYTFHYPAGKPGSAYNVAARNVAIFFANIFIDRNESMEAREIWKIAHGSMPDIKIFDDSIYHFRMMKVDGVWWVLRNLNHDDPRSCDVAYSGETLHFYEGGMPARVNGIISGTSGDGMFKTPIEERGLLCPVNYHVYNEKGERVGCFYEPDTKDNCSARKSAKQTHRESPSLIRHIFAIARKKNSLLGEDKENFSTYIRRSGNNWLVMRHFKPDRPVKGIMIDGGGVTFIMTVSGDTEEAIDCRNIDLFEYLNYFSCEAKPDLYDESGKPAQCMSD